jgi:dTDP-4-dehydrorhamnose reductase
VRLLLLGAGGQVGRAVLKATPAGHQVIAKTRAELDIADARAVEQVFVQAEPDWIVNAAAYTAVDLAEDQPNEATRINDTAVGILAQAALRSGGRLLHLSTDFVFDGRSSRAYLPSDGAHPFALTMLKLMREREQVKVVSDQIGTPTWAGGLAAAIWDLTEGQTPAGVYHWTDLGVASWYDFAVAIQEEALARGLLRRAAPIEPIVTAEYPTRAARPAFSVLNTAATRERIAAPAVHWRHNLRKMLDELHAA